MQVNRTSRRYAALALSSVLFALSAACASVAAPQPGRDASKAKAKPAKQDDTDEKREKLAFDLEDARAALRLAELGTQADEVEAGEELEDAQRKLEEAGLALKRFQEVKMPAEIASGQLGIERAMQGLSEAKQELAQMEAMYAAEANLDATGEATRDMVLERHRKRVEFSTRSLELSRAKFQDEVGAELPLEQRGLEAKLRAAERGLRKAEQAKVKGEIERMRTLGKARHAVSELERKLTKLDEDGDDAKGDDEDAP